MDYVVLHNNDVTDGFGFKWPEQYDAFMACLQQMHVTNTYSYCSVVTYKNGCIFLIDTLLSSFILNEFTKPRCDYMRRYVVMQALGTF
jgi:hypothetical protein